MEKTAWIVGALVVGLAGPAAGQERWSYSSGEASWSGRDVSLGNYGTQVFSELGAGYPTQLLSSFDQDPPAPVWTTVGELAFNHSVASAERRDLHASLRHENHPDYSSLRNGWLRVFTSESPDPIWSARLSTWIASHDLSDVFITPDGEQIVTAVFDTGSFKLDLEFFRPDSSIPFKTLELDIGGRFYALEITDNADRMYVATGLDSQVYELENGTRLARTYLSGQVYNGHGFAGDGSYYAIGTSGGLRVFREQSDGSYAAHFVHSVPYDAFCNAIAISNDGSTMAAGFNVRDGFRTAVVQAIELKTGALLMSEAVVGNGQLQNIVTELDISRDGMRIAAALSGDGSTVDELRIYDSTRSIPLRTERLEGSALDVDLSADGTRVAVGCKDGHTSQLGSGGCIDFFQLDAADLKVHGVPRAGGTVDVEVNAPSFSNVVLFISDEAADEPTFYGDLGLLYLRRAVTSRVVLGATNGNGYLRSSFQLPANSTGRTIHMQGFLLPSEQLTQDWIPLTIVP